eukprot:12118218-Alexandrium_andersonii.AAC.1
MSRPATSSQSLAFACGCSDELPSGGLWARTHGTGDATSAPLYGCSAAWVRQEMAIRTRTHM